MARNTFVDAATAVSRLVATIEGDRWENPGLGVWTVRDLVGHTSRALVTVLTYLERPAERENLASPEAYFAAAAAASGGADADQVAERGREAGRALGADPAGRFRELVELATARIEQADDDQLVPTIAGGMRLINYLPTRTFELVVHGLDIARATGRTVDLPTEALAEVCALAGRVAVQSGRGSVVLEALTGRTPLPAGFSLV